MVFIHWRYRCSFAWCSQSVRVNKEMKLFRTELKCSWRLKSQLFIFMKQNCILYQLWPIHVLWSINGQVLQWASWSITFSINMGWMMWVTDKLHILSMGIGSNVKFLQICRGAPRYRRGKRVFLNVSEVTTNCWHGGFAWDSECSLRSVSCATEFDWRQQARR